ncbi:hypothetical protein [Agrococcus citreus]|uniref:Uncharacterized protein n=1 Tax=Agrococcus citreus TaxID=84643 RepID=A0ABN1YYX9_9MICO
MATPEWEVPGPSEARGERSIMPAFVMPDVAASDRPIADRAPDPAPPLEAVVEPSAAASLPRLARPGERRRQLLVAALIGLLVGMVVPGGIAAAEQMAAQERADRLRATASAYLAAIAVGRSDEATALVPLPALAAPAGARGAPGWLLESADRIRGAVVPFVHVEGQAGRVVVRYRVADRTVTRTLEAEQVDGAWRFIDSLAEPVVMHQVGGGTASIAGTLMTGAAVQLYPGVYRFDAFARELVEIGGNAFEVDGDPGTRTEAVAGARIVPAVHDRVIQVALAASAACQQQDGCVLAPDAAVRAPEGATLLGAMDDPGAIDLVVPLEAVVEGSERWTEMRIRVTADELGSPAAWLCSAPGAPGGALEPCP